MGVRDTRAKAKAEGRRRTERQVEMLRRIHALTDDTIRAEIFKLETTYGKKFLDGTLHSSGMLWRALTSEKRRRIIGLDGDIGRRVPRGDGETTA